VTRAWLVALGLGGCDVTLIPPGGPITAVSFNVQGSDAIGDPETGPAIAGELAALEPDFAALQECVSCDLLLDHLPARYALVDLGDSEIGILYDRDRWDVGVDGLIDLGDQDGWGVREARWASFFERATNALVFVYSTHWCVPIRSSDDACDEDAQLAHARTIAEDAARHDAPVILGGDLNVFDGFEDGRVLAYLTSSGLVDTLREVTSAPVITFDGNTWAPPGRIDYVLASSPVDVLDASVAAASASDHGPVSATLSFTP